MTRTTPTANEISDIIRKLTVADSIDFTQNGRIMQTIPMTTKRTPMMTAHFDSLGLTLPNATTF